MTAFIRPLLLGLGLLIGASACGKFDAKLDCDAICERYRSCFDTDYNVSSCSDRCQDSANADDNFDRKVEICDTCIDGISCTATAFECAADCSSIIP